MQLTGVHGVTIVIGASWGSPAIESILRSCLRWALAAIAGVVVSSGAISQTLVVADGELYRLVDDSIEPVPHLAGSLALATTHAGVWVASPTGLELRSHVGELAAPEARRQRVALQGTPVDASAHALNGELWVVTAERQLVRFMATGELMSVTPLADPPLRVATASDSSWILGQETLSQVSPEGTTLANWRLDSLGAPRAELLTLDPLGEAAWVGTDRTVVRVDARSGSADLAATSSAPIVGLAYDPESHRLWVAAEDELLAIDDDGGRVRLDALQVGALRIRALGWDPRQRALLIADEQGVIRLDAETLVATRVLRGVHAHRFLSAGFLFGPTLDVREGELGLIVFTGARCEGRPCDLGAGYRRGMSVTATAGELTQALRYDPAVNAWPLPRDNPGAARASLRIDVEDRFGQRASATVEASEPGASTPASGSGDGEVTIKSGGKNQLPLVTVVAPAAGSVLVRPDGGSDWSVPLQAEASDPDGRITQLEFRSGSTILATLTSAPWAHPWTNPTPGVHSLTAIATDDRKAKTTSTAVSVRVNSDPVLAISAPADGALLDAATPVVIQASAADSDGLVTAVDFFVDGFPLGSLASPPFAATWHASTSGAHAIEVRATDNDGGQARRIVNVLVEGTQPPMVVLTSPEPCTIADFPGPLLLSADAASPKSDIARVDFLAGDSLIGSATAPPFRLHWADPTPGSLLLTARAHDSTGQIASSKPVPVTVRSSNHPPTISLTAPVTGAGFVAGDTVQLAATASDVDGTVSRVDFLADGVPFGSDASAPYSTIWTTIAPGTVRLKARATDDRGATADSLEAVVNVTANSPPHVVLLSPLDGAVFAEPASVIAAASASDGDGSVARVDFLLDGRVVSGDSEPPYEATLSISTAGLHTIAARATDQLGAATDSQAVTVAVNANVPPQVVLTMPSGTRRLLAPATIELVAAASDSDGSVVRVEFYNGSELLGVADAAPYSYIWSDVAAGTYSVVAVAIDDAGARWASAPVSVSVEPFSVAIDSVVGGFGLHGNTAQVSGTMQGPIGSAVTVNDVIAAVGADRKFHVEVPLAAGENVLHARVATHEGTFAEATATVVSDGIVPPIRVTAHPLSGLAPLVVVFTVENRSSGTVDVRFDGGPPTAVAAAESARFQTTFTVAGTYATVVDISDEHGTTASRTLVVVARSFADADAELRATYDTFTERLRTGAIPEALQFVTPALHADYQEMFETMGPGVGAAVDQLGFLDSGPIGPGLAEYALVRGVDGVPTVFFVYFVQGADGLWRVGGM
jgi:hypothetical protein